MTSDPATYWNTNADLLHITANENDPNPEGFDVGALLLEMIGVHDSVIDFGCGTGRMAALFKADRYLGVDINPAAVEHCRKAYPHHWFGVLPDGCQIQPTDIVIAYTVCLHMSDAQFVAWTEMLAKSHARRVLIAEITGREWRRGGDPPVFNRERLEYVALMEDVGFRLDELQSRPYVRYIDDDRFEGRNTDIDFMLFERR